MNRTAALWVLVAFFGSSVVFAGIGRMTADESAGVRVAAQVGALIVIVVVLTLIVRRLR
ncbi:MAG TPA: hypothetical protein VD790_13265 [Thermoleophilaceae bacterium]|nr:hypothetical protein [Thermoleophilaceae bacterium]